MRNLSFNALRFCEILPERIFFAERDAEPKMDVEACAEATAAIASHRKSELEKTRKRN
jgi:hypothetical protein